MIGLTARRQSLKFKECCIGTKKRDDEVFNKITLNEYCWYSNLESYFSFEGANNEKNWVQLTTDSCNVAYRIIREIERITERYGKPEAILTVISSIIGQTAIAIEQLKCIANDPTHIIVLDDFLVKTQQLIAQKFSHIQEQVNLTAPSKLSRELTIEICSRISNFKLGDKKLITGIEGTLKGNEALFFLLCSAEKKNLGIKKNIN